MEKDPANRFQTADELRRCSTATCPAALSTSRAHAHHRCRRRHRCHQDPRAFRLNARYGSSVSGVSGQNTARSAVSSSTGSYEVEKPKSNKNKIIAAVIAAVAVIGVVVAFATGMFSGEQVTVPDVLGKDRKPLLS